MKSVVINTCQSCVNNNKLVEFKYKYNNNLVVNDYLIIYELHRPGQSYEKLWSALRSLNANRMMNSAWLFSSECDLVDVYQKLLPFVDSNDKLFITEIINFCHSFSDTHIFDLQIKILEKKLCLLSKQFNSVA